MMLPAIIAMFLAALWTLVLRALGVGPGWQAAAFAVIAIAVFLWMCLAMIADDDDE